MFKAPPLSVSGESPFFSDKALIAICLLLPYLVLYWLVPLFSNLTIGNDYSIFPIEHQMALMFSLEHGSFPLYVPGFAMGQSASALTLGQIYHPVSHISSLFPGYWDGDALTINTQVRLFSLGIAQVVLFLAIRRLGVSKLVALIISFIGVYNLRMLDMFRYGASLENFTAFIMLGAFILMYFIESKKRYFIGIVASSYLLVTGGHPQMAYIGFLGAALLTLIIPSVVPAISSRTDFSNHNKLIFLAGVFVATLVGLLLALPYILGFYFDFLAGNTVRTGNSYEWSLNYQDTWGGLFRSLYDPLNSNVHGVFGGSALIVISLLFPLAALLYKRQSLALWLLFGLSVFVFLLSAGGATPVHKWVWEFLPFASNFRTPGRFALMLAFPVVLMLVWLFSLDREAFQRQRIFSLLKSNIAFFILLGCGAFLLLNIAGDKIIIGSYSPTAIEINSLREDDLAHRFYLGIVVLIAAALYFEMSARKNRQWSTVTGILLLILVFLETTNALRHGTWVKESKDKETKAEFLDYMQKHFAVDAEPGSGMSMGLMDRQIEKSMYEPKIARFYRNVTVLNTEEEFDAYMIAHRQVNEAVVVTQAGLSADNNSETSSDNKIDHVKLVDYQYNQVTFDVDATAKGMLSTNFPYRENWSAWIDGNQVDLYQANGYEVAVFLPAGKSRVIFKYDSDAIKWGMLLSWLSLSILFVWALWNKFSSKVWVFAICVLPLMFYWVWYKSLHGGSPIGVTYKWDTSNFPKENNIAYGKKTFATSTYMYQMGFFFYPGLAVDGEVSGRTFATAEQENPSWKVEFGDAYSVEAINIYAPLQHSYPLFIINSPDGVEHQTLHRIDRPNRSNNVQINFSEPIISKHLVVISPGNKQLGFKEVEILGERVSP